MPRKKYKSDRIKTTLSVTRARAKEVRSAAARARKTAFAFTDNLLAAGLQAPKPQI